MASSLSLSRARTLLLKPSNEALHRERLRAAVAIARRRGRRGLSRGRSRGRRSGGSRGRRCRGRRSRLGSRGGSRRGAGTRAVELGTRDDVGRVVAAVDVEQDALVLGRVQLGADGALGVVGAAARDLDVHALRVVLGAALGPSAVQRDGLVSEDVLARGERGGNGDAPRVVVGDHLVGCPVVGEALAVDLDPREGGLICG